MVEAASASGTNDGTPYSTSSSPSKLAGPAAGLAILDKKGELSRAEGITSRPGGVLEVRRIGPHTQVGDVDFQASLKQIPDDTRLRVSVVRAFVGRRLSLRS